MINAKLEFDFKKILVWLFIFDCGVMPVIKFFNVSFKISYIIAFVNLTVCLMSYVSSVNRGTINDTVNNKAYGIMKKLLLFISLLMIGELFSIIFFEVEFSDSFSKIVIGYLLMIGSLFYGYHCKRQVGEFVFWVFILNMVVNCLLSLIGRAVPSIMLRLYSIALETYTDGYYRNGGILGNPNSSLLVMNMLLLFIILLYKYKQIQLSSIKVALLYILPIATDIIVSSRGELLHTILLLIFFTVYFVKYNKESKRFFLKLGSVIAVSTVVIFVFWTAIVPKYPNIQRSLDRMTLIESVMDMSSEDAELSSIERPFLRYGVFKERFVYSPVWGTGVDGNGNKEAFVKGTTGYHNDIFMILGSTGIIGFALWFGIVKESIKRIGICMIFPFLIAGLSNTFVQSYFGTMLYFFIIGYFYYQNDLREKHSASLTGVPQ